MSGSLTPERVGVAAHALDALAQVPPVQGLGHAEAGASDIGKSLPPGLRAPQQVVAQPPPVEQRGERVASGLLLEVAHLELQRGIDAAKGQLVLLGRVQAPTGACGIDGDQADDAQHPCQQHSQPKRRPADQLSVEFKALQRDRVQTHRGVVAGAHANDRDVVELGAHVVHWHVALADPPRGNRELGEVDLHRFAATARTPRMHARSGHRHQLPAHAL
jgi:hypothetical protein